MSDTNNNNGGIVTGFILGSLIGAGITLLFGTKKGKELRGKIRKEYPEFFDQLSESFSDVKENLSEKYGEVASEVEKIKKEVGSIKLPKKHRFFKGKKPL